MRRRGWGRSDSWPEEEHGVPDIPSRDSTSGIGNKESLGYIFRRSGRDEVAYEIVLNAGKEDVVLGW